MHCIRKDVVMDTIDAIERTFFLPLSGLDAVNYIVICTQIKVAIYADVPVENQHFVDDLRDIISIHKQFFKTVVAEDGSVRKSTHREVIERMEDLLLRLDEAGLRLCFRMWSILSADELVKLALSEADTIDSDVVDDDHSNSQNNGYGAVVGFLIVPQSLPVMIPDSGNGHPEICVDQVPDWDALSDQLTEV
jgi:hypothetical protein